MIINKYKILFSSTIKLLMGIFVVLAFVLLQQNTANAAGGCTFASAGTSDWNTIANWSCGRVPVLTDDVTIPAGTTTQMSADATCQAFVLGLGSTLNYAGKTLVVNNGTWSSQGILTGNGTTTFAGAGTAFQNAPQTIFYNLVIAITSGAITMDTNVTTTNDVTLNAEVAGALDLSGHKLLVGGDWLDTSGESLLSTSGIVEFNGTAAQSISNEGGFYDLTINKTAGVATITGTVTTTRNVTLQSGTLALGAQDLNVKGDWIKTGGLFDGGTGTVKLYKSASAQRIDAEPNFYNLEIANTGAGSTILDGNVTTTNNVNITASIENALNLNGYTLRIGGDWSDATGLGLNNSAGTVEFNGSGDQSISTESNFYDLKINKTAGSAIITGNVTSTDGFTLQSGTFDMGAQSFSLGGDWSNTGGTLDAGTGTVVLYGAAAQEITEEPNFYDLLAFKSLEGITLTGDVGVGNDFTSVSSNGETSFFVNATTHSLTVTGSVTVGVLTTVTSTSGTLTLGALVTNNGNVGSSSGNILTGALLNNGGATFSVGSGSATSTGIFNNGGTFNGNAGRMAIGGAFLNTGTFNAGTGSFRLTGATDYNVTGVTFYNLENYKSAGIATIVTNPAVVGGALTTSGAGTLNSAALALSVTGASTIGSGTTVTSTSGDLTFAGVTNAGGLGTVTGNFVMNSLTNSGTVNIGAQSTSTGDVTNTGTLRLYGNTLHVGGDWDGTGGTLTPGTGTIDLNGTGAQAIGPEAHFYNLTVDKTAGTATLAGNVTTTNNLTITEGSTFALGSHYLYLQGDWTDSGTLDGGTGWVIFNGATTQDITTDEPNFYGISIFDSVVTMSGNVSTTALTVVAGTLAVDDKILYAPGAYQNENLVTVTTGEIKHDADQIAFVNSSGVEQTSYTTPASVYFQVNDPNINMSATNTETLVVSITVNSTGGSDSISSLTLTETGAATGIFRSAALPLYSTYVVRPSNSELEINHSGTGTMTYTDAQDSPDTGTGTVSLVYAATSNTDTSTGGGGGGGGLTSPVTTYQSSASDPNRSANLANLASMNLSVNALVKLPDDGNLNTQEDSAVYFIGKDGKRHAFPNSRVFYTWYTNFDSVIVISADKLASIPLGSNVRYRPGSKMLKFTTDPKTYAVGAHGILRWVKTETAAISLYGSDWNTKIDDMSDAFFGNYQFGEDINSSADFSPEAVRSSMLTVSDDYGW